MSCSWKGWLLEKSQINPVGMNVSVLIKLFHIKFYWKTEDTDWITRFNSFSVPCICGVVPPSPPPAFQQVWFQCFCCGRTLDFLDLQRVITRYHRWLDWSTKMFSSIHGVWLWGLAYIWAVFSVSISCGLPEILWGSFYDCFYDYEFCWTWWTSSKIFILSFTESCVWQVSLLFSQMRNESRIFRESLSTSDFSFVAVLGLEPRVLLMFMLSKYLTIQLHSHSLNAVLPSLPTECRL